MRYSYMDSYFNHKVFRLSVLAYSLFLPFTPMSAFSAGEESYDKKTERKFLQKSLHENNIDNKEDDTAGVIAQNVQRVGSMLSSSPSQLTEQAKSYALGKINSTINTETQKWLSQFGTARINFSLDRKGKLDNGSLDLLLPLYDNKEDWLVFSQLGYRNKDSRHTVNLGLGGRYFTPDWMYGLNTFFDHDVTGNNKRLGLGGEAWTDYVKLSANTYWRLSKWRDSPHDNAYEERPANGFDLNSEFFLPAYPNLGGKLSYEQYFGDNVALFNRDTKQKDPSLARFGLNYTPIPLVTMGVDYKLGSGGSSETLFLANLNYRFGMPFSYQISPDSVASMRTLAGSRYDLVERNNNIVLDYKKKPELAITLPSSVSGYSSQMIPVTATIVSSKPVKNILWKASQKFAANGGVINGSNTQNPTITLPQYQYAANGPDNLNVYPISVTAEEEGRKTETANMDIVVEPFVIKDGSIKPHKEGPVIADGRPAYDLAAAVTYGRKDNAPLKGKDIVIPDVKWSIEPANPNATLTWTHSAPLNSQGQLTATLGSNEPLDPKTTVYLEIAGMPKVAINDKPLDFTNTHFEYNIDDAQVNPKEKLAANSTNYYTFTARVLDKDGKPLADQEIKAKWNATLESGLETKIESKDNYKTNSKGELTAILRSANENTHEITATLSVDNGPRKTFAPVEFVNSSLAVERYVLPAGDDKGNYKADGKKHTLTAYLMKDGKPLTGVASPNVKWSIISPLPGITVEPGSYSADTGEVTAIFSSTRSIEQAQIGLSVDNSPVFESPSLNFVAPDSTSLGAKIEKSMTHSPDGPLVAGSETPYVFSAKIVGADGTTPLVNQSISDAVWKIESPTKHEGLTLEFPDNLTTDKEGNLTARLTSTENSGFKDVTVSLSLGSGNPVSSSVAFLLQEQLAGLRISTTDDNGTVYKKFYSHTQQGEIHYLTKQLRLDLTRIVDGKVEIIGNQDPQKYTVKVSVEPGKENMVKVDESGQLSFPIEKYRPGQGSIKISALIKHTETGQQELYTYTINPKTYVFGVWDTKVNPHIGGTVSYNSTDPNQSCETLDIQYSYGYPTKTLLMGTDVGITESEDPATSYSRQFDLKHFLDFGGIFYEISKMDPATGKNPNVKVKFNTGNYGIYDARVRAINRNLAAWPQGLMVCQITD
ncbi:hypothetical protein FE394_11890 [Xenorhabdus sp. Reich]|uniref:Inverse autotransporter beta-domain domain-containing protein n=2 Tax=Xenorhabdus littoralis TaxID=2582835 RepID=A0ABU4SMK6_9GAMM|nr:hypothetical protein [Xenorhabdus sp. Reich]